MKNLACYRSSSTPECFAWTDASDPLRYGSVPLAMFFWWT